MTVGSRRDRMPGVGLGAGPAASGGGAEGLLVEVEHAAAASRSSKGILFTKPPRRKPGSSGKPDSMLDYSSSASNEVREMRAGAGKQRGARGGHDHAERGQVRDRGRVRGRVER